MVVAEADDQVEGQEGREEGGGEGIVDVGGEVEASMSNLALGRGQASTTSATATTDDANIPASVSPPSFARLTNPRLTVPGSFPAPPNISKRQSVSVPETTVSAATAVRDERGQSPRRGLGLGAHYNDPVGGEYEDEDGSSSGAGDEHREDEYEEDEDEYEDDEDNEEEVEIMVKKGQSELQEWYTWWLKGHRERVAEKRRQEARKKSEVRAGKKVAADASSGGDGAKRKEVCCSANWGGTWGVW